MLKPLSERNINRSSRYIESYGNVIHNLKSRNRNTGFSSRRFMTDRQNPVKSE